jgi:acyl-CoA thioester hydrolase
MGAEPGVGARTTGEFRWPVRVYYEDTDAAGLVYHSNYLKFMERARTEWLRLLGHGQDQLRSRDGVLFVVRRADVEFMRPARIDQLLEVTARITRWGGASMRFEQSVCDGGDGPLCRAQVEVVCIDAATLKPCRLPDFIKEALTHVH